MEEKTQGTPNGGGQGRGTSGRGVGRGGDSGRGIGRGGDGGRDVGRGGGSAWDRSGGGGRDVGRGGGGGWDVDRGGGGGWDVGRGGYGGRGVGRGSDGGRDVGRGGDDRGFGRGGDGGRGGRGGVGQGGGRSGDGGRGGGRGGDGRGMGRSGDGRGRGGDGRGRGGDGRGRGGDGRGVQDVGCCGYGDESHSGGGRGYDQRGSSGSGYGGRGGRNSGSQGGYQNRDTWSDYCGGEYTPGNLNIMSTYIDTHCHLEYVFQKRNINGGYDEFLRKHRMPHNYEGSICVFCDPAAFSSLGQWEELLKHDNIWGAFGCHPHNAKYYNQHMVDRIVSCLSHPKAVAWGEVGLDYHYNNSPPEQQRQVFIDQIHQAIMLNKPLVVHSRDAEKDTYDILKEHLPQDWLVHVHCFGDSSAQALRLLNDFTRLYIGITGVITFPSAEDLRYTVANIIPLDRLLLETDSPYMIPKPYKGVCHPGFIPVIAQEIANLKGVSLEEVFKTTRLNTKNVYGI